MSEGPQKDFDSEFIYNYKVEGCIGSGAFGTVYKCMQTRFQSVNQDERVVAVKLIEFKENEESSKRKEIELLRALDHPNIIKIFKSWVEYAPKGYKYPDRPQLKKYSKGAIFIETEFCDLESLWDWFHEDWRQQKHAKVFLYQIASGVKYLHDKEIIHRDLKPQNILLKKDVSSNVIAKICDFGISRQKATFMTSNIGTHGYISPEVLKGNKYTKKADVYAIGVMFYEMLVKGNMENKEVSSLLAGMMLNDETNYAFQFLPECEHLITKQEKSLIQCMVEAEGEHRPNAQEIIQQLRLIYVDLEDMKISTTSDNGPNEENDCHNILPIVQLFREENARIKREQDEITRMQRKIEELTLTKPEGGEKAEIKKEQVEMMENRREQKKIRKEEVENARIQNDKSRARNIQEQDEGFRAAKGDRINQKIMQPTTQPMNASLGELDKIISKKDNLLKLLNNYSASSNTISGIDIGLGEVNEQLRRLNEIAGVTPGIVAVSTPHSFDDVDRWKRFTENVFSIWRSGSFVFISWELEDNLYDLKYPWSVFSSLIRRGDFISDGRELKAELKKMVDKIVPYLKEFQTKGIVPIISLDDSTGRSRYLKITERKKFFELTRAYLTSHHGLHSLLWCWSFEILYDKEHLEENWPGNDCVDVISVRMGPIKELKQIEYEKLLLAVQNKPISMQQNFAVPIADLFVRQPRWTWFTTWSNSLQNDMYNVGNSVSLTFQHPSVISGNINPFITVTSTS